MLEGCTAWPKEFADEYIRAGRWQAETLGDALAAAAARHGERVLLKDDAGALTYAQVERLARRVALGLLDLGLRRRDIVLLQLPNVREFVIVFFALHKIGVVPVMCLPAHRRAEIAHFAAMTSAKAHFFAPGYRGFDFLAMARGVQAQAQSLRHLIATGNGAQPGLTFLGPWMETADRESSGVLDAQAVDPYDVAFLLLSGGTTGVPKLIPRTHADYLYNARECARVLGWGKDTVFLAALPAAHNFALGQPGIVAVLAVGGSVVLCPSTRPQDVLGATERHHATVLPASPALLITVLDHAQQGGHDLGSLRQVCVGGQRMLPELFDRASAAFERATILHAFGMAEGMTNLSRPGDPQEIRRATQGRPVSPADEFRIVDDAGAEVGAGEVGELIVRGPYTIRGYYRAEEHNRSAFTAEGFYRTGDLVRLHPSGNFVVEGRKKDVINRGGEKISAEEVENLILGHPAVRMAAVVAMPDAVMGERGCAFVVAREGAALTLGELTDYLLQRQIAKFKLPERLELVDAMPVTAMGKVSKKALREMIAAKLAAEAPRTP